MLRLISKLFRGSVWWVGTLAVARWFTDSERGPERRVKARELIAHARRRAGDALETSQPDFWRSSTPASLESAGFEPATQA